jgi:UTP--glucose-1-phosphate uridylyltransferase
MLPIVDKPLIQYAVEEADGCGIKDFIIITGKNKRAIEDHFDKAYELEDALKKGGKEKLLREINTFGHLDFAFIRQGVALGLGHAIYCARHFVGDEPFAVILSDDLIPPDEHLLKDMIKLHEELDGPVVALMKVPREATKLYGVIAGTEERKGVYRVTDLVEKPEPADAPSELAVIGRYILTPDIFDVLKNLPPGRGGEIQLTDAIKVLSEKRPVYGFVFEGRRYDAGSKLGFLEATVDFALAEKDLSDGFKRYIIEAASRLKD